MVSTNSKQYNFYLYGDDDGYGQPTLSEDIKGNVKLAIYETSQSIQDNIRYKDATYIGLTLDKHIDDTYVIEYGDIKLKVLYVNPQGRYRQVFMKNI